MFELAMNAPEIKQKKKRKKEKKKKKMSRCHVSHDDLYAVSIM